MTRALRRGLRRAAVLLIVGAVLVATGCGSAIGPVRPAAADLRTDDLGRAPVIQQSPTTVGISSAAERPWRFWLPGEPSVSAYKPGTRRTRGSRPAD